MVGGGGAIAGGGGTVAGGGGAVVDGVTVTITPSVVHARPGSDVQFKAAVMGATDMMVTWAVRDGASGGSIDAQGNYTAPTQEGTFTVTATSGKSFGTASVVVGSPSACSALMNKGVWEAIAPQGVGDTTSVAVDPFDPATVWLGTTRNGFFKSLDCGATWTHVNTGMNGAQLDSGSLWSMVVDPVDKGTIYLVGAYGALGLYKSTNGGVDFAQVFTADTEFAKVADQNFVNAVSMEANNHLHLVVSEHGTCKGYTTSCEAETTDGGVTWKLTATPLSWGEGGGLQLINATSWLWGGSEGGTGTWLTTDNGKTWKQVMPNGKGDANGEFTIRPLVPASDHAYYIGSLDGVMRSPDGFTWSLVSTNRVVGFAVGDTTLYAIDQWSPSFHSAAISDPMTWKTSPAPSVLPMDKGCPYLDYDAAHHVLYASCFGNALWRLVTQPDGSVP